MQKKIKNEKGITLIALTVTVIILVLITGTIVYNSRNQTYTKKLDELYSDIDAIENKLSVYYSNYGELPVICEYISQDDLISLIKLNASSNSASLVNSSNIVNSNDDDTYYVIDLGKLDGLSLTYGYDEDYNTIKTNGTYTSSAVETDIYIVNNLTHQIYYPHGIFIEDVMYYTTNAEEFDSSEFETSYGLSPTETTANADIEFETEYATIDVIWLDTDNNVISSPNKPELSNDMQKVTWTYSETSKTWTEDEKAQSTWYNYVAGSGTDDNLSSMWANVKIVDEDTSTTSYFVWIPRYAYRITYYSDEEKTNVTGYFDGYGCWSVADSTVKYALDSTLETVTYNGKTYIVHPAFVDESELTDIYGHGGWDKDLAGIWVGKYEVSGSADALAVEPNVKSLRNMSAGDQYTAAINYNTELESHMIKNSEWGAVAYLTHSQYGRNGNEIDINNSFDYYTGNGGGSTSASSASGITNAYNTETGAKASSTGNVYGIYDLSGGAWERVAAFNNKDTSGYLSTSDWTDATGLTTGSNSTKYATKYGNSEETYYGTSKEVEISKIGDALIEVNMYIGSSSTSETSHWFSNYSYLLKSSYPFFDRGGDYSDKSNAGIFSSENIYGTPSTSVSFRLALCL